MNNTPIQDAHRSFATLFGIEMAAAQKAFDQAPVAVKKRADAETSKRIKNALTKANIEAIIKLAPLKTTTPAQQPTLNEEQYIIGDVYSPDNSNGYEFKIEGKPDFAFLSIQIPRSERLKIKTHSMVTMDTHIKKEAASSASIAYEEYSATGTQGEISLGTGVPGDIFHQYLQRSHIYIKSTAYLASTYGIEDGAEIGLSDNASPSNHTFIKHSGEGDIWFYSYGATIEVKLDGTYIAVTDNVVAWTTQLSHTTTLNKGYQSAHNPNGGYITQFSGKGILWLQSRSDQAFTAWAKSQ